MKVFVECNQAVISGLVRACELYYSLVLHSEEIIAPVNSYLALLRVGRYSDCEFHIKILDVFTIRCVWLPL